MYLKFFNSQQSISKQDKTYIPEKSLSQGKSLFNWQNKVMNAESEKTTQHAEKRYQATQRAEAILIG